MFTISALYYDGANALYYYFI